MTVAPEYAECPEELRLDPFTATNWKSPHAREEWRGIHGRMARAKREAEWRSVMDDRTPREAAIVHVSHHNRDEWLERVGRHGLEYRQIRHTAAYDGFSHKHMPVEGDDPERISYSVVARDEGTAEAMVAAENERGAEKHRRVGELLGFPECCIDHFEEVWLGRKQIDPIYEIACNTPSATAVDGDRTTVRLRQPNPGTNVMWRYFGWSFITHLPCSFECERSVEVARNRYRIMAESGYEGAADAMARWLDAPHVWSGYHAIAEVTNRWLLGATTTSSYWSEKSVIWRERNDPGGKVPGEGQAPTGDGL